MSETKIAYHATQADLIPGATFGYMVVAVVGYNNDWSAYRAPVDWTSERVAHEGDKISREAAESLFPVMKWAGLEYRE